MEQTHRHSCSALAQLTDRERAFVEDQLRPAVNAIGVVERIVCERIGPRLCSQCGERDASMLKIGTTDGWCTSCLDEAGDRVELPEEVEDAIRALLTRADAMNPEAFKSGQDHLPPAFREIDFRAAFLALVDLWNELEREVLTLIGRKCECSATGFASAAYHGGQADRCPRDAAEHEGVVTSPALCLPCLHGCAS